MTRRSCAAVALVLLLGTAAGHGQNPPGAGARKYRIDALVCQGDPLGSREDGTVRHLADAKAVVAEGSEAWIAAGGQSTDDGYKPPYFRVLVTPTAAADGKTRLRIVLKYVGLIEANADGAHARGSESYYVRTAAPGETVRVRWGFTADLPDGQPVWADISVHRLP